MGIFLTKYIIKAAEIGGQGERASIAAVVKFFINDLRKLANSNKKLLNILAAVENLQYNYYYHASFLSENLATHQYSDIFYTLNQFEETFNSLMALRKQTWNDIDWELFERNSINIINHNPQWAIDLGCYGSTPTVALYRFLVLPGFLYEQLDTEVVAGLSYKLPDQLAAYGKENLNVEDFFWILHKYYRDVKKTMDFEDWKSHVFPLISQFMANQFGQGVDLLDSEIGIVKPTFATILDSMLTEVSYAGFYTFSVQQKAKRHTLLRSFNQANPSLSTIMQQLIMDWFKGLIEFSVSPKSANHEIAMLCLERWDWLGNFTYDEDYKGYYKKRPLQSLVNSLAIVNLSETYLIIKCLIFWDEMLNTIEMDRQRVDFLSNLVSLCERTAHHKLGLIYTRFEQLAPKALEVEKIFPKLDYLTSAVDFSIVSKFPISRITTVPGTNIPLPEYDFPSLAVPITGLVIRYDCETGTFIIRLTAHDILPFPEGDAYGYEGHREIVFRFLVQPSGEYPQIILQLIDSKHLDPYSSDENEVRMYFALADIVNKLNNFVKENTVSSEPQTLPTVLPIRVTKVETRQSPRAYPVPVNRTRKSEEPAAIEVKPQAIPERKAPVIYDDMTIEFDKGLSRSEIEKVQEIVGTYNSSLENPKQACQYIIEPMTLIGENIYRIKVHKSRLRIFLELDKSKNQMVVTQVKIRRENTYTTL